MEQINESHTEETKDNISNFDIELSHAAKESESQDQTQHQCMRKRKILTTLLLKKDDMFNHLHFDLFISNKEKSSLKIELKNLKENYLSLRTPCFS